MLYYLFQYLEEINTPGAGVFQYLSFRSGLSVITALLIASVFGKRVIRYLQKKQIGETVRDLGLEGQYAKKGTPTMGGIIIIGATLIPTLLFARLDNVYVILMIVTTIWMGIIGFADDYIKVFKKHKSGLQGKFKIMGQVALGLIVGLTLYLSEDVVIRIIEDIPSDSVEMVDSDYIIKIGDNTNIFRDTKSTITTIPFFKKNEFDYSVLVRWTGEHYQEIAWIVFILIVIIIVTAVSNGANITDGLDGLATGSSAIMASTLGILAYVSGNVIYADYLNIMYIPHTGELVVFGSAFIGATIGFLWYNSFPAQVFMGDTGSLTIGGILAVFAIIIRKELLIPLLCGIFLVENLSVIMQVYYFKYTRIKFGQGRRIFKMAPLHHHYQKKGYTEPKIVIRFWIVGIILAVLTIITLKIR
jgi:phospho-N-acetylmuramoyl-pentapeptide-transferase